MKTTFTVENEFNFLSDHVPGSVFDNDFERLPLPPDYEILLFGENQPEISIDRISDFDDFLNNNIRLYDNFDEREIKNDKLNISSNHFNKIIAQLIETYGREAFGLYLPFHYYYLSGKWGIYLFKDIIEERALFLYENQDEFFENKEMTLKEIKYFYYNAVFRHECFHYQTEIFSTRAEIFTGKPLYDTYNDHVVTQVRNTYRWLEEALAESSVLKSKHIKYRLKVKPNLLNRIYKYDLQFMPPGYRDYECKFCGGPKRGLQLLSSQILNTNESPSSLVPNRHTIANMYNHDYREIPTYLVSFKDIKRIF